MHRSSCSFLPRSRNLRDADLDDLVNEMAAPPPVRMAPLQCGMGTAPPYHVLMVGKQEPALMEALLPGWGEGVGAGGWTGSAVIVLSQYGMETGAHLLAWMGEVLDAHRRSADMGVNRKELLIECIYLGEIHTSNILL